MSIEPPRVQGWDRFLWTSVTMFVGAYSAWHFNVIPESALSLFTQAPATAISEEPVEMQPVLSSEALASQSEPGAVSGLVDPAFATNNVAANSSAPVQSEPTEQPEANINHVWKNYEQSTTAGMVKPNHNGVVTMDATIPKRATSSPILLSPPTVAEGQSIDSYSTNPSVAAGIKDNVDPALMSAHFEEQHRSDQQQPTGNVTQTSGHPLNVTPASLSSIKAPLPATENAPYRRSDASKTPPNMDQPLTYNPERNKVQVQLLPTHQTPTPEGQIRLINDQQTTPMTEPKPSAIANPLIDQPVSVGTPTTTATTVIDPKDEIMRLRDLSQVYWTQPAQRPAMQKEIDELAKKIYFQKGTHYLPGHKIAPGDELRKIAREHDVPWEYMARMNQVNPAKIRAGDTLKIIKGPFSAVVDLSDFELIVHNRGYYVCRFPVCTGKNNSTPRGTFKVKNKEVNPVYYGPEGVIERDSPMNPLGERWIDLGDSYGIHGTIDPDSIGKAESKGCVRLRNQDVEVVYDLLIIGSEVTIHD